MSIPTLSAMNRSVTFRVTIVDDMDPEPMEQFFVDLAGTLPAGVMLAPSRATVTILKNDQSIVVEPVTATLSPDNITVPEGMDRNFEIRLSDPAPEDLTFTLVGDSAYTGDYTLSPDPIVIMEGDDHVTVTIRAVDDPAAELVEVFMLSLMSDSSLVMIGDPSSIMVTIPVNDQPVIPPDPEPDPVEIGFSSATYTVDESAGEVVLTVSVISGDLTEDVMLNYMTQGGTATTVEDYTSMFGILTLSPGDTEKTIMVPIVNDDLFENDEMFTVHLFLSGAPAGITLDPAIATVTITDNDEAPARSVSFVAASSTSDEGTTANVEVRLDGDLHKSAVVVSFTVGGTAVAGTDYTSPVTSVTIPAGMRSATITFAITSDSSYDGAAETVVLTLTSATGDVTVGTPSVHTVMITDNETAPTVIFNTGSSTVDEGTTATVEVRLDGDLHESAVVVSFTVGGTADAGVDYTSPVTSVTIPAGMRSAMITFAITSDSRYDGAAETVVLTLTSATGDVTVGTPSVHTVMITDNETAPTVIFNTGSSTSDEGTTATVEVRLDGDLHESDVVVSFTIGGTATPGTDFTAPMTTVTIPAGMHSAMITFAITSDSRYEGAAETVVLTLTSATGGVTVGTPSVHTVTITDNDDADAVVIGFDPVPYSVDENDGSVVLTVKLLNGTLTETVVVNYETMGGSAIAGKDYMRKSGMLTWSPGTTEMTITVSIIDDITHEPDQMFTVELIGTPADITLDPAIATVTITDDDSMPTVTITPASPSVEEGEDAVFTVTLTGEAEEDIEVTLTPTGDTAETSDYSVGAVSVTFSTGDTSKMLRLGTTEDQIYEVAETVSLGFSISGPATIASAPSTLTITNDDSMPTVTITPASPSVEEGEDAVFTVTLTGEAEEDIEVTLTPTGDTAETSDYSVGAVSVTFSTGDTSKMLRLGTTEDQIYEDAETVSLGFSISGPATIASAPSTLTITNDDSMPTVTITPASPSVVEGEDAVFTVTLTGEAEEDIEVTLTPTGDTAETSDYSVGAVSVTFSTGDTSKMLRLGTTEDQIYEDAETVSLGFSISGPATIASAPSTLTITNDDSMPTVTITPASPSVVEGKTATFTVTLTGEAEEDIEVTLTPTGDTAETSDYSVGAVSVTFSTGDTSKMLRLGTTEDQIYEDAETVSLGFSISGPATIASAPSTLTITNDDSMPTVTITPASPTVEEGEDAVFMVTLNGEAEEDIVVTLTPSPGSGSAAAEVGDYSAGSVSVTFSTGDGPQTLQLQTTEDVVYEVTETVSLGFSISGPATIASAPSTLTITNDDSMPTVTITPASPSVEEGEDAVFTVTLNGEAEEDIVVTLTPSPGSGSAAAEVDDYSAGSVSVTFSTGDGPQTLRLPTTEDEMYEGNEEVALSFSISGPAIEGSVPSILTIEDDDTVMIGFDPVMYTVDEKAGMVTLTVKLLSGDLGRDVTLSYETINDSAVAGEDYTRTMGTVTLSTMTLIVTFTVPIIDDDLSENAELFTVLLNSAPVGVVLMNAEASVAITDDEDAPVAEIGFESVTYEVSEGISRTVLTISVISGVLAETVTLTYATVDGSALSGVDYGISTGTVELSPRIRTATIEVSVLDDSVVESAEIFFVNLGRASVPNNVALTPFRASVTIEDNDIAIGFESLTYRVGEDSGTVELTVSVISGVLMETITLNYKTMDGSAIAGEDYTSTMSTVTLSPMTPSVTFTVPITDDDTDEPDQMFTVVLSGAPADITLDPATATVTIIDNDAVVIGFDKATYSVNEGDVTVVFTVSVINGVLMETITLNYETMDGSAIAGEDDYVLTTGTVTLTPMTPSVTFTVDIMEDTSQEPAEEFTVVLSDAPAAITLDPAIATVTIPENDQPTGPSGPGPSGPGPSGPGPSGPGPSGPGPSGPDPGDSSGGEEEDPLTVSLGPAEQTVNEGDQIVVTVTLSEASDEDITVTLTASGGTADTDDHGLTMQETLTIAAGDLTAMFTISTTDDAIYEGDETLVLSLSSSAEVERNADESEITISDNDPIPTLSLEQENLSVREGSSITIRARLSNVSAEAILVALILEGQTALLGSDFPPPVEFSTEIAPGAEFAEFIISTVDDSIYEPVETVLLQLVVVEGNVTEGTLAGTLSITDDDPMPALSIDAPDEIIEGTTELVTIRLNAVSVDPVTVRVSVGSDSNVSEDDYTLSAMEVTIEPGQLEATVMLSVVDDGRPESSEILVLEVAADGFATVQHRITVPGLAIALVDVDSEAESCDQSGGTCVEVEPNTYSEPLLLFVEQVSDDMTNDIPAPTSFMFLPGIPLWDIEFQLESDPNQLVSELDGRVRVNLSAPRDLVDANGGAAMISIATLHKGSTEWELLETTYDEAGDTYNFYAYTTRFSYFALTMSDDVSVVEPPVEPVEPPSSGLPITLLVGIGIGLAVLVVVVIIVVVVIRRKKS